MEEELCTNENTTSKTISECHNNIKFDTKVSPTCNKSMTIKEKAMLRKKNLNISGTTNVTPYQNGSIELPMKELIHNSLPDSQRLINFIHDH